MGQLATAPARVLVIDDDADLCESLRDRLQALGFQVSVAGNGAAALRLVREEAPAIVLLDLVLPGMDGVAVLEAIRRDDPEVVVIVITAHGTIARAVEAMKKGAYDFVTKPFDPKHLEIVLGKALERQALRDANALLTSEVGDRYSAIVGESPRMLEAVETARRAAPSGATVLLLGESGTGKEVVARAIHRWSLRSARPFVVVNCVALSEELLESEPVRAREGRLHRRSSAEAGQARDRPRRHGLSRRDRRHSPGPPGQAASRPAGPDLRAGRRDPADPRRSALHRGDQPRPAAGRSPEPLPPRSVLPAQRGELDPAAAPRAAGRHRSAGGSFLGSLPP
jgi:FixJ family two-component response regulator